MFRWYAAAREKPVSPRPDVGAGGKPCGPCGPIGSAPLRSAQGDEHAAIQSTLDAKANVVSQSIVGNVLSLPVISKTTNAAGQTVEQVKDVSGAVIEVTLDASGKVIGTKVVSQPLPTTSSTS